MAIRSPGPIRLRTVALLLLLAALLLRVGPFCEVAATAAGMTPAAMAGCGEKPTVPAGKTTAAHCATASCVALMAPAAGLAAPMLHAAPAVPPSDAAGRDGLDPAPATPPPRPA